MWFLEKNINQIGLYKIYSNSRAYNAKVTLFCANHQEKRVSIEENHFIFFFLWCFLQKKSHKNSPPRSSFLPHFMTRHGLIQSFSSALLLLCYALLCCGWKWTQNKCVSGRRGAITLADYNFLKLHSRTDTLAVFKTWCRFFSNCV